MVNRKTAYDPEQPGEWFDRSKKIKEEKGILDSDTYNFDETGFGLALGETNG